MKKKILIVEDDEDIRANLEILLGIEGYAVEVATDGRDALNRLARAPQPPSLILLDLMMPVMDGYQFLEERELQPKLTTIPVVIITASGRIEVDRIKSGATAILKKPFEIELILDTIKRYC